MAIYTAENGLLGGTGDILLEVGTENFSTSWVPAAPQCSVGPEPSVRFDFTVAGADAHIATGVFGHPDFGYVVHLDIFGETLGLETAILSHVANGYRPLRLRPDGKIAVYDSAGTFLGASTSSAAGVWRRLVLVEDPTSTPRAVYLYVDNVVEMAATPANAVLAGMTSIRSADGWGWGDKLPAGQSTGTVYRLRNAILRSFTSASESPTVMQWPDLRVAPRRVPTSEGDWAQWRATTPSPNTWQDVDEFPNDGATTAIFYDYPNPSGERHDFRSYEPNPLPEDANILGVQVSCAGFSTPPFSFGYISTSAGLTPTFVATNGQWRGLVWLFRSGFTRASFDPGRFQFGVRATSSSWAICSNICYQVIYWTDLLPLAAPPSPTSVKRHYSFIY